VERGWSLTPTYSLTFDALPLLQQEILAFCIMINYDDAYINKIIVHRVGNKSHEEGITVSDELVFPNEALRNVLMDYFLKPFTKVTETYHFVHNVDIGYNVVNDLAKFVFNDQNDFKSKSVDILRHLYDQSNHPHIKTGDLFIVLFGDVLVRDELVDTIGIFKSEDRLPFLDVIHQEDNLEIVKQLGISINISEIAILRRVLT